MKAKRPLRQIAPEHQSPSGGKALPALKKRDNQPRLSYQDYKALRVYQK